MVQLTNAMGLVASSKIRRATDSMMKSREYEDACLRMINMIFSFEESRRSVFAKEGKGSVCLVAVGGDRGLAGGFNAGIFKLIKEFGSDSLIIPIGKRICDRVGGGFESCERFTLCDGTNLARKLCYGFLSGEYSKVGILYTSYVSVMSQSPQIRRLLPIVPSVNGGAFSQAIFEPSAEEVFESAVITCLQASIMRSVRESFASEIAARRVAMDSAGKSARDMTEDLRLRYNRARQSAITAEITEIVAGSN